MRIRDDVIHALIWHGMIIVKISEVPGFGDWLYGQTLPYVEEDSNPTDWAYYGDFVRFVDKKGVID